MIGIRERYFEQLSQVISGSEPPNVNVCHELFTASWEPSLQDPKLHVIFASDPRPMVVFRQVRIS